MIASLYRTWRQQARALAAVWRCPQLYEAHARLARRHMDAWPPAEVLAALALRGTRTAPVLDDGTAVGADGTFLSWDEAVLTAWRTGGRV